MYNEPGHTSLPNTPRYYKENIQTNIGGVVGYFGLSPRMKDIKVEREEVKLLWCGNKINNPHILPIEEHVEGKNDKKDKYAVITLRQGQGMVCGYKGSLENPSYLCIIDEVCSHFKLGKIGTMYSINKIRGNLYHNVRVEGNLIIKDVGIWEIKDETMLKSIRNNSINRMRILLYLLFGIKIRNPDIRIRDGKVIILPYCNVIYENDYVQEYMPKKILNEWFGGNIDHVRQTIELLYMRKYGELTEETVHAGITKLGFDIDHIINRCDPSLISIKSKVIQRIQNLLLNIISFNKK
ncbi:Hypothetical protein ORPV_1005 [Orpheovirus IHUMI-LCC2]|uniref:Uncharacterized protein n=1 Tax=Orpheovirus IHUMI-LCC2 TaxID=2023057 RepID=A0A2I2L627_9VIRU|nr:Hypothetical protein ORPV_1005 [Orpheovirus IHUMI-LCC2]SNW62909.1 Hypothetical protein ORPV_1005 [Orpheovirus IHUMI-LCC2]